MKVTRTPTCGRHRVTATPSQRLGQTGADKRDARSQLKAMACGKAQSRFSCAEITRRNRELSSNMKQSIILVALVVRDYDEAIEFFCQKLHFTVVEDTYQPDQDKRWVVVTPPGAEGINLLLARASTPEQEAFIGNQTGGRVFLFLNTDDFWRDYNEMLSAGINFVREPKNAPYGTVAVFEDLYGNLWDLFESRKQEAS